MVSNPIEEFVVKSTLTRYEMCSHPAHLFNSIIKDKH